MPPKGQPPHHSTRTIHLDRCSSMPHEANRLPRLRLDTRHDTSMQESLYNDKDSPVNGHRPHGLPTPANDVPSSGFTAVNGESARSTSFRPADLARHFTSISNSGQVLPGVSQGPTSDPSHTNLGRRSDDRNATNLDRESTQQEGQASERRGRKDSNNSFTAHEDSRGSSRRDSVERSPKRRMLASNAGALSSFSRNNHSHADSEDSDLEPATAANNVRASTPIYRANRGTPPPPPPREAEDALAKSLQATLGPRNDDDIRRHTQSASPEAEQYDGQQPQGYGHDQAHQGEGVDPKKRKRNFSNRTKTGCHTCRSRKKKCDEGKPICENCKRGGFECGGYGPKPPGGSKISAIRSVVPLQAKYAYDYPHGPGAFYDHPPQPPPPPAPSQPLPPHLAGSPQQHSGPSWDPHRQDPYANAQNRYIPPPPMPVEHRPPTGHDPWGPRPQWPAAEPAISYVRDRLPPVDFSGIPPPASTYSNDRQPLTEPWRPPHSQSQYRPPPAPPTVISNHSSASGRSRSHLPGIPASSPLSERAKMLTGQPYKHVLDDQLLHERASCKQAVEGYNEACAANSKMNGPEKERRFHMIMDPSSRDFDIAMYNKWNGPVGECGARTIVEAPFTCEYGYNIRLGNDILISANCLIEDACQVSIGHRTIVGKNVKFYCMTTSVDPSLRAGSQGDFRAGAIIVEEDCVIGADAVILPFRTIGRGSTVGAGSVVTRDVKPGTVVAGNPAKPIRKRKIESGPNVDRHDDAIQEENDKMLDLMRKQPFGRERIS